MSKLLADMSFHECDGSGPGPCPPGRNEVTWLPLTPVWRYLELTTARCLAPHAFAASDKTLQLLRYIIGERGAIFVVDDSAWLCVNVDGTRCALLKARDAAGRKVMGAVKGVVDL